METYLLIAALVGAAAALIFALIQRSHVMKASEGNEKMVHASRQSADSDVERMCLRCIYIVSCLLYTSDAADE